MIQDANHDNGIKAWVVCPGFVDTEMGQVVPGADTDRFLRVEELVDVVRCLCTPATTSSSDQEILVPTMHNPMAT